MNETDFMLQQMERLTGIKLARDENGNVNTTKFTEDYLNKYPLNSNKDLEKHHQKTLLVCSSRKGILITIKKHTKMNNNITNQLMTRVYNDIGEKQIENLLLDGTSLMTHEQIAEHIKEHLDDYLSADEQKQLVIEVQGCSINDEIDYLGLKVAIQLTSVYLQESIEKIITNKSFIGNNQFDPIKNPKMFMLSKYLEEVKRVKLNIMDAPEGCPF